jgi:hypothetical protein
MEIVAVRRLNIMYYEEKMINGILHWRNDPDGKWTAYTSKELSDMAEKYRTLYYALVMEVGNRSSDESRHETALRYIREAESNTGGPANAAQDIEMSART